MLKMPLNATCTPVQHIVAMLMTVTLIADVCLFYLRLTENM